jgi:thiol-disulfide isomerase/thioredoxin
MKNKKTFFIIALVFVLLIGGATVLYRQLGKNIAAEQLATQSTNQSDESAAGETEQKIKAPDFTVYDTDGNEVHLADYIGKPIVLNFWASWCGPCQSEMPDFHEKYLELGDDVHFLMINMTDGARETVESASAFIAKNVYAFPVFYDTKSDAASIYGAYSLPTTFFIDADGYAIAQATGAIDAETLQRGLDMIK